MIALSRAWELLHSDVGVDEDYARLRYERDWELAIDPRHMGLIHEQSWIQM